MIKNYSEMISETKENMRGGAGTATLTHVFKPGEFKGNARLCAKITLEPGCSIGFHEHIDEEEIYYIISGKAVVACSQDDAGTTLNAGDASLTLGGESHSIRNPGPDKLELLALILTYNS